jgi:hypothetical protein
LHSPLFPKQNAVLVIDDEGLVFENDTLAENSEDRRTVVLFENVSAWGIYDLGEDVVDNGVQLECKDGHYFFSVDDINNFRVCFEYFWNIHRTMVLKLSAQPGTTHGRKVNEECRLGIVTVVVGKKFVHGILHALDNSPQSLLPPSPSNTHPSPSITL